MIRWRWPVQITLLALFVAFTVASTWPADVPIIPTAWLQWNPLVAGAVAIAARTVWATLAWSLILVLATMLVGRFFCGWMCPLGTILDLSNRVFSRFRKVRNDEIRPRARWKYYTLIGVIAIALTGSAVGLIFDPLVLLTRTVVLVFIPFAAWAGYGSVILARTFPGQAALSVPFLESPPLYTLMTTTALVFVGIVLLERIERRFWCRNLCPLGALLALLGRTGLVKRSVEAECSACSLCEHDCPMGAIPTSDFTSTHRDECILCMRCSKACSQSAVRFGMAGRHDAPGFVPERRQILAAAAAGVGVGLLSASSTHADIAPARVIRPPGSIPEDEFLARCTRCLACVEACPTHGLQPLGLEAGWSAIWTPVLVPTIGGCEEPCHNCTQVCPTDAIRKLTHEEKSFARIGTARILRERCVAWEEIKACLVCDEVCPYDAIDFLTITDHIGTQRRPVVNEEKCMGCGLCENACPVREPRAIVVDRYGEERLSTGSYVTPRKRQLRELGDDRDTDYLREYRPFDAPADDAEPLPPGIILD